MFTGEREPLPSLEPPAIRVLVAGPHESWIIGLMATTGMLNLLVSRKGVQV